VLATVIYEPDFAKGAKELAKALEEIKGKFQARSRQNWPPL